MVSSNATTVDAYLASLPDDRRASVAAVRDVVRANLPPGFVEAMQYGMIGWGVPLSRFPSTYNGQPLALAALAAQKRHLALYLMGVYGDAELSSWFAERYRASGKKLDMGKSCVRFQRAEDLPLELIGQTIAKISVERLIELHDAAHAKERKKPSAKKKR